MCSAVGFALFSDCSNCAGSRSGVRRDNPARPVRVLMACLLTAMHLGCDTAASGPGGLEGAKFKIPVYPGARIVEHEYSGHSGGDSFSSLEDYDDVIWTLETSDPAEKVVAFYESQLPQADKDVSEVEDESQMMEMDDDELENEDAEFPTITETLFVYTPDGGDPDDSIEITINRNQIVIFQTTKRK